MSSRFMLHLSVFCAIFVLAIPSVALQPLIINPDSMHPGLRVVLLVDASQSLLLDREGISYTSSPLSRDALEFVDPTPCSPRPEVNALDLASDRELVSNLVPRSLMSMTNIPVRFRGGLIAVEEAQIVLDDDLVGANPTPYPYPVPIFVEGETLQSRDKTGWVSGVEPSPFIVSNANGRAAVRGFAALMEGNQFLGLIGIAAINWNDGTQSSTDRSVLFVDSPMR